MSDSTLSRKPKKPITGSDLVTARIQNRVIRKIKPAARKLGLTKNGVIAKAVEQFVDAALSPAA